MRPHKSLDRESIKWCQEATSVAGQTKNAEMITITAVGDATTFNLTICTPTYYLHDNVSGNSCHFIVPLTCVIQYLLFYCLSVVVGLLLYRGFVPVPLHATNFG